MPKSMLTVSIDSELVKLARGSGLNISGEVNEYLKARLVSNIPASDNRIEDLTNLIIENENKLISLKKQLEDATKNRDQLTKETDYKKYAKVLGWEP